MVLVCMEDRAVAVGTRGKIFAMPTFLHIYTVNLLKLGKYDFSEFVSKCYL